MSPSAISAKRGRFLGNSRDRLFAFLVLAVLISAVYGLILPAPVIYDDLAQVRDNPIFQLPFSKFWEGLTSRDYFQFTGERTYQPLVTLLHYYTGQSPWAYRWIGIALHVLNSFLVFSVGLRFTGIFKTALFASILFALFPAHTETINISSFKGHLLSFSFTLLCLLSWNRTLTFLFCFLALLSKETGLIAVVFAVCPKLRLPKERPSFLAKGGLVFFTAAYLWFRFIFLDQPPTLPLIFNHSSVLSLGWYLKTLFFPHPLCLEHTLSGGFLLWFLPLIFFSLLLFSRKSPNIFFYLIWMGIALLPFLHFIPFANFSPVADRYLYLSSAGFCLLLGHLLGETKMQLLLYGFLVFWGGLTLRQNALYRTPRALFERTAACAPENPRAQYLLASSCFEAGDYPAAERSYLNALRLRNSPGVRTGLGDVYLAQGLIERAREQYREAMKLQPDWRRAYPDRWELMGNGRKLSHLKLGNQGFSSSFRAP